jgi:hypothetical protein
LEFRIADTFTNNLARLTGEEQKAVKTTRPSTCKSIPRTPGMSFHKLDKADDKSFWPAHISSDIHLIARQGLTVMVDGHRIQLGAA